jgi:GntR family transcriptional regulator
MELTVDSARATPPSRQIVEAVLDRLAGGELRPGERLPSVRCLAAQALVNPNTVGKAYRELEVHGVVEGRAGAGVFVTEDGPDIARAQRRGATLRALRDAARTALRAGHDASRLLKEVERAVNGKPVNGDAR